MLNLKEKKILVTGVSRPIGIGAALVKQLSLGGATVLTHGFSAYDYEIGSKGASKDYGQRLGQLLEENGGTIYALPDSNIAVTGEPERIIKCCSQYVDYIDGLVVNHTYSTWEPIENWSEDHIDRHLQVNVRGTMLLIKAFIEQLPEGKRGSITLMTSGQYLRPMINEIAYCVSKDAVNGLCRQLAVALGPKKITVNCVNPGATDTGYLEGEAYEAVARSFPTGQWLQPEDASRLVSFLQSDDGKMITGQIIASEGGFNFGGSF